MPLVNFVICLTEMAGLIAFVMCLCAAVGSGSTVASGHPNVLLIVVDDLRPTLGCYGDMLALTPNIDSLAREGITFTRAYAQQALCGPSRTSFLTSRRPDTTRLFDVHSYWRRHAGNFTTLPQYFKDHGYHTVSVGKIFHPGIVSNHSDDQPYSWSEQPFHPPTQVHKMDPVCLGSDGSLHTSIYCPVQVEEQPGKSLPDIETTQFAVAWLQQRAARSKEASTKPFFLAVGYHKPHIPLKFPAQFLDLYPISSVPLAPNPHLPPGLPSVAWNPWNDLRWRADIAALNVSFPYGPLPDFYARYVRQGYYAATTYTDALIGDLLHTVDTHFPDTIITFIGDHGWSLGEHQEWSKFSNFEVSTRVPFIVSQRRQHKTNTYQGYTSLFPHTSKPRQYPGNGKNDQTTSKNRMSTMYNTKDIYKYDDQAMKNIYKYDDQNIFRTKYNLDRYNLLPRPGNLSLTSHDGLVELVDLFPTLVDLAGLPALDTCPRDSRLVDTCTEGTSLSPLLHLLWGNALPKAVNAVGNARTDKHHSRVKTVQVGVDSELLSGIGVRRAALDNAHADKQHFRVKTVQMDSELLSGIGVKRAAFSQYPRPGLEPSVHPDSDQCHARDATVMGYSMRTGRFRYTAWLGFNGTTLVPDWSDILAQELYDHQLDPQEDHNVVANTLYECVAALLHTQLRRGWRHAVSVL